MDALLSVALQELAVEGPEGCMLTKLWSLVQTAATGIITDFGERHKQFLWQELIKVPGMLLFLPKSLPISSSDPRVHAVDSAERLEVHLVAPEALRDSSLGLYDLKVCDARLSKEQRDILERIAKSRSKGITQSQLAKEFKVAGNKMFYLVKMLEVRGLVVRQTTLVRTADGKAEGSKNTPIVATNLLHLTRYAKDLTLSSHQRFEILNPSKEDGLEARDSVGDDVERDEAGDVKKGSEFVIKDDFPAMGDICQRLEETEGKVLVVGDLKATLGYRKAVGHRTWRRLVKRLQDAGVVDVFNAQIERKVRPCIRLLKSFDVKALSGTSEEIEDESTLKREKCTEMVMELSIDQQIYDLVSQSGSEGMQMMEVFNRLGLQNKRNYSRIVTMLGRQCLVSEAENHKRSTLYRLKTIDNANGGAAQKLDVVCRTDNAHSSPDQTLNLGQTSGLTKDVALVPFNEISAPSVSRTLKEVKENARKQQGKKSRGGKHQPESAEDVDIKERQNQGGTSGKAQMVSLMNKDVVTTGNEIVATNEVLDIVTTSSPARIPLTRTGQHYSGAQVSTTRAQREQRILEKLRAEKFILRVELHRWLEDLENRKDTMMDRKTLCRILQALQHEGLCKCVLLSMPGLTNCGRQRTTEVVLLPSVNVDPELLSKVHDKVRKFDMDCRGHGQSRVKKKDDIPVLTGVRRMSSLYPKKKQKVSKFDTPNDGGWSMQANGFIPAKMVRVSMLHHFLWSYVNNLSDEVHVLGDSGTSGEMVGSCRMFGLANAIQTMPLELFLQIIGSVHKIENASDWCKRGSRLCDLPKEVFSLLLDSNATGRLSWLVDVLRRLKLVRLVMGCGGGIQDDQYDVRKSSLSAVLTYAMEREPYLEEPAPNPLPSFSLDTYDLSPRARHEFSIAKKDGLEAYWHTLEYFYSGAQPAIARHAFPGSNVPELFGLRSWTSLRIMSVDQRRELLKRIGAGGIEKRKSAQECVQIAKDLNLTLEQVLRVSYEKNRVHRLQTLQKTGQVSRKRTMASVSFAEPFHVKAYKKQRQSELEIRAKDVMTDSQTEKIHPGDAKGAQTDQDDVPDDDDDEDVDGNREQAMNDFSFVASLKPLRQRCRRFIWSERLDRLLICAYVKQRAQLGTVYPRVDWSIMEQLPAPAAACRRRMAQLRQDLVVRKAIMSLCTLVAARYVKQAEFVNHKSVQSEGVLSTSATDAVFSTRSQPILQSQNQIGVGALELNKTGHEVAWDDMEDPFLAAALDEIIRCNNLAKASASKRSGTSKVAKGPRSGMRAGCDFVEEPMFDRTPGQLVGGPSTCAVDVNVNLRALAAARASSTFASPSAGITTGLPCMSANSTKDGTIGDEETMNPISSAVPARFITATGPTRKTRKQFPNSLRKSLADHGLSNEQQVRKSVGVANAVELVKLVLLNSLDETELFGTLVDGVQRLKETEVFTAVKYLREKGLLMAGQGGQTFVLSPKFFHDCCASRFPVGTGDQWLISEHWLDKNLEKIEQDWVPLPVQQQAGQLSHLLASISTEEFTLNPSLPLSDIGEVEEKSTRRPVSHRPTSSQGKDGRHVKPKTQSTVSVSWACERRERGFPGVEVSINRSTRSVADILEKYGSAADATRKLLPQPEPRNDEFHLSSAEVAGQRVSIPPSHGLLADRDDNEEPITCVGEVTDILARECGGVLHQIMPTRGRTGEVETRHAKVADATKASCQSQFMSSAGTKGDAIFGEQSNPDPTDSDNMTDPLVDVNNDRSTVLHDTVHASPPEGGDESEYDGEVLPCQTRNITSEDRSECVSVVGSCEVNALRCCSKPSAPGEIDTKNCVPNSDAKINRGTSLAQPERLYKGRAGLTGATTSSTLSSCIDYFSEKASMGRNCTPYLMPELLEAAYHLVQEAGEEGLTLQTIQENLQTKDLKMEGDPVNASDYVQALESFNLVKKVNAFDHVRVIDFPKSLRFHLNIFPQMNVSKKRSSSSGADLHAIDREHKYLSASSLDTRRSNWSGGPGRRRIGPPCSSTVGNSGVGEHRVISLRADEEDLDSNIEQVTIVPWLNRHGTVHATMLKSLTRRVMGIVALHPGIAEDTLLEQLTVLNPQSARQLLQLLEADGHIISRSILQPKSDAPRLLQGLFKGKNKFDEPIYMKHYFSNPMSGGLL